MKICEHKDGTYKKAAFCWNCWKKLPIDLQKRIRPTNTNNQSLRAIPTQEWLNEAGKILKPLKIFGLRKTFK